MKSWQARPFLACEALLIVEESLAIQSATVASQGALETSESHSETGDYSHRSLRAKVTCACWKARLSGLAIMFERAGFPDELLHHWLDCRGPPSGQPGERYWEYTEMKKLLGFA